MHRFLASLVLVAALTACSAPTEVEFERVLTLHVAAAKVTCNQWFGPTECLQVRDDTSADWRPLYEGISGFTHEDGFAYELRVVEFSIRNPPADGSSREYRLARIVKRVSVPE